MQTLRLDRIVDWRCRRSSPYFSLPSVSLIVADDVFVAMAIIRLRNNNDNTNKMSKRKKVRKLKTSTKLISIHTHTRTEEKVRANAVHIDVAFVWSVAIFFCLVSPSLACRCAAIEQFEFVFAIIARLRLFFAFQFLRFVTSSPFHFLHFAATSYRLSFIALSCFFFGLIVFLYRRERRAHIHGQ